MPKLLRPLFLLLAAIAISCSAQTATPTPTLPLQTVGPTPAPATAVATSVAPTPTPTEPPASPVSPTPAASPPATATPLLPTPTPPPPTPTPPLGTPTPVRSLTPDTGLAAQIGPQLQAALDEQQVSRNIPGLGAAVIFPDGSIWSSGSGDGQLDPAQPATGDTPFVVGSISKTFVTAAVMQLVAEGELTLDDPLSNWLPDYPDAGQITIRQLLHHTSGIYNYFEYPTYNLQVFGTMKGRSWTPQEILDTFAGAPYFPPGAGYHYSNTGFILLGMVVEQITGQKIGDVLQQRFFTPLGLHDTYFGADVAPPPTAAQGYLLKPDGFKQISDGTDYRPTISAATVAWAAGSIDSSARDIAAWGDALYGGHVVSPGLLAQMEDWTYYPQADETYGLGTRSRVFGDERMFGHTGSIRGFDAAMWHFPDTNMTVVALTNRGRIDANPIVDALATVALPPARGIGAAGPQAGALAGAVRSAWQPSALSVSNRAQLQAVLDQQRTLRHIPGIRAAIIFPDGSIWKGGSGYSRLTPQAKAAARTPFVVGSITKTFVTAAVMQLAEEGRLSIDDPLSTWLPDYPGADQMTLRHLLSHTSGVFNYFEHPTYNRRVFTTDRGHSWTPQEILDSFVGAPYFAPGEGFHYSNTGFILLGLVVEQVTGQQIGDVLEERFFTPLGLTKTWFQGSAPPPVAAAQGYLYKSGVWRETSDGSRYRPTISGATVAWAAGAVVSTARDIAKWCDALYGGQVVSAESLAQLMDYGYSPYAHGSYGLGTWTRVKDGARMFGHTGSLRGFDAAMWHYPDADLTIVVLTNLGRIDVNPIVDALSAAALPAARAYFRQ